MDPETGRWFRQILTLPEVVDISRHTFGPVIMVVQLVRVEVGLPEPHYRPRIAIYIPHGVWNVWNLAQAPPPPPYEANSLPPPPPANMRRPENPPPPPPPMEE